MIFQFIERNSEREIEVSRSIFSDKKYNCFVIFQLCSFGLIIFCSVLIFYKIAEPKAIIDETGSDLIYEFRKINVTSHRISEEINEINAEKYKIPIDKFGIFSITNIMERNIKAIEQDVDEAADFSHNMLKNPNLTNYSISLIIFFNAILLMGLSILSMI